MSAQIEGVRNLPNGGARVVTALELSVEGSRKPAMTARAVYVYFP